MRSRLGLSGAGRGRFGLILSMQAMTPIWTSSGSGWMSCGIICQNRWRILTDNCITDSIGC